MQLLIHGNFEIKSRLSVDRSLKPKAFEFIKSELFNLSIPPFCKGANDNVGSGACAKLIGIWLKTGKVFWKISVTVCGGPRVFILLFKLGYVASALLWDDF